MRAFFGLVLLFLAGGCLDTGLAEAQCSATPVAQSFDLTLNCSGTAHVWRVRYQGDLKAPFGSTRLSSTGNPDELAKLRTDLVGTCRGDGEATTILQAELVFSLDPRTGQPITAAQEESGEGASLWVDSTCRLAFPLDPTRPVQCQADFSSQKEPPCTATMAKVP